jgi:23S rRNA (cytosine1962-C5)-methyltransferase
LDWARDNIGAAQLPDSSVRWILDDALKFLRRESNRGHQYEGIILNPPAFGRGPKGELWRLETSLPKLFEACAAIFNERATFVLISINGVSDSSLTLFNLLNDWLGPRGGKVQAGELVLQERTANRPMSMGIFGSWSPHD